MMENRSVHRNPRSRSRAHVRHRPLPADLPRRRSVSRHREHRRWLVRLAIAAGGLLTLGLIVFVLAGCGEGGSGATTTSDPEILIDHPLGSDELVLRVEVGGGFVPVEMVFANMPQISVYGDGRVITQGPVPAIFPGPALPNLQVARLSEGGLQTLLAAARDTGMFEAGVDYGQPLVADGSTTTFTVNADGRSVETAVYHLAYENESDGALTREQKERRADLLDFQTSLMDLPGLVGQALGPEEPFEWDAISVLIQPADPGGEDPSGVERGVVEWPLADPATLGEPHPLGSTTVLAGSDLEALMPLLRQANQLTLWRSGDAYFALSFRPLLPDEVG